RAHTQESTATTSASQCGRSWRAAMRIDSLGDLKFHGGTLDDRLDYSPEQLLDYRRLIERVSRTAPGRKRRAPKRPVPMATCVRRGQCPKASVQGPGSRRPV